MSSRTRIQVVAILVVVVFAVGIWSSGDTLKASWLRFYSLSITVAALGLAVWDRFLWRLRPVQRLTAVPPDARGTWKGTLTTLWKDPRTGLSPAPKTVFLVVRQTASNTIVMLLTDESRSVSSVARVVRQDGQGSIDYMYLNKPRPSVEDHSRVHHGSTALTAVGAPVRQLEGRYWTDRDSRGELFFGERVSGLAESFTEAMSLFN
jgi:hypothetical protein